MAIKNCIRKILVFLSWQWHGSAFGSPVPFFAPHIAVSAYVGLVGLLGLGVQPCAVLCSARSLVGMAGWSALCSAVRGVAGPGLRLVVHRRTFGVRCERLRRLSGLVELGLVAHRRTFGVRRERLCRLVG